MRNQSQLLQSRQSLLFANFIHDLAILQSEDSCAREIDFFVGIGRIELANRQIVKCDAGMSATPDPTANNVIPLGNQREFVRVEGNIRECLEVINFLAFFFFFFFLFF